ncbi:MAG: neutral/alkaline non-lysosomal ceramidase N-terminal domain-containing protein, partial [Candidatus Brocadiales bacterium]|nr:neutral/alkaline non-lysosomal ceramidase N-terminal domain-containing protein [Candidatus Bathyanammoxibius sp.]
SHVMVSATHTHSGPQTSPGRRGNPKGNDLISGYSEKLEQGIVAALKQAHNNAQKGKLTVAHGELPGIGFNRRFIMSDRSIQTHPLTLDPHIVGPEGPDAKHLFVFCAYDEDGKPLGTAINFSCHATVMERRNENISADFPGKTCDFVNEKLGGGALSLYLQGTCGNICQVNPLDGTHKEVGLEWTKVMGRKIGSKALELIKSDAFEVAGPLRATSKQIELTLRQVDPALAAWALNYKDVPEGNPVLSDYGAEKLNDIELPMMSLVNLFETPWWANRYARTVRLYARNNARTAQVTVKVFAQDNWALVSLPGEFFMEFGDAIHERSPYKTTIVVGYANGSNGYIPTRKAFGRGGGYETNIGTARFTPDAGYLVVDAVVEMLQTLRDM